MTNKAVAVWAARRALMEGCAATCERVALACQISVKSLTRKAKTEGWILSGAATGMSRAQRIARVHDRLLEKVEKVQLRATDDDEVILDKASIAELSATARVLAKISEGAHDEENAQQNQTQRDEDLAAILKKLDDKILELASHLAQDMALNRTDNAGIVTGKP